MILKRCQILSHKISLVIQFMINKKKRKQQFDPLIIDLLGVLLYLKSIVSPSSTPFLPYRSSCKKNYCFKTSRKWKILQWFMENVRGAIDFSLCKIHSILLFPHNWMLCNNILISFRAIMNSSKCSLGKFIKSQSNFSLTLYGCPSRLGHANK